MRFLLVILASLQAYLLGSINFAVILSKFFIKSDKNDVREYGSGNAGMTNMIRVAGVLPGILTFVLDVAKGYAASYIGGNVIFGYLHKLTGDNMFLPIYGALFCGIFCVIGHIFPIYFGFRGGKAVAVSVGIFFVANWPVITVSLGIFLVMYLITRIVSVASLTATLSVAVCTIIFPVSSGKKLIIDILTLIICAIVFLKHSENIDRIVKGKEKPLV